MKIVKKSEAERFADGSVFVAHEYDTKSPDLNTARIDIRGRYPAKGSMRNTRVKEIVYVESGSGKVIIEGESHEVEQGDAVFFESGEKIIWDGHFALITTCAPAWSKDQHEMIPEDAAGGQESLSQKVPAAPFEPESMEKLVGFFLEIESFKKTLRYATCPERVRDSAADHSWKTAFMAMVLARDMKNLDAHRSVRMCLVHDLAESVAGNVDSYKIALGEATREQKNEREKKVMLDFKERIPGVGDDIYALWQEYERHETAEARFAKALEKIEALIHMLSVGYVAEKDGPGAELTATFADKAVEDFPELRPLLDTVKTKLRKEFEKLGFEWKKSYGGTGQQSR